MTEIAVSNLSKSYGDIEAVRNLDLTVQSGELLCLLGPSGCGKSTILRMLSGLETPTNGTISFGGTDVTDVPANERQSAMVFQTWALFPYKSVLENVAFGLKMQGRNKSQRHERAHEMLEIMDMESYADQDPMDLSGGQQQRVALARSLAVEPDILLLDEPLSSLDKQLRESMQIEIKRLHERFNNTMVYVTHDQDEAFTLADRIGIMNDGELIQIGSPWDIYHDPKTKFVEEFLGETNGVDAIVDHVDDERISARINERMTIGIPRTSKETAVKPGQDLWISVRPAAMELLRDSNSGKKLGGDQSNGSFLVDGRLSDKIYRGSTVRYFVNVGEQDFFLEDRVSNQSDIVGDSEVTIKIDVNQLLCFRPNGDRLII